MKLLGVGFNWKTPVRLREQLAFDATSLPVAVRRLRQLYPHAEFAILSTCNRTEIYAARPQETATPGIEQLADFFAAFHGQALPTFYEYLYFHEDTGAVLHLFKVAGGLDSLVLGEAQILGQVRHAYQTSCQCEGIGPCLHALFQRAFAVAKRVHNETGLTKGRLSIASAAVDYVRGVFDYFTDKTVLVIGAGKMAELTLVHLRDLQPKRVVVCNRNLEKARELANRFGGSVRPLRELPAALVEADIVISSTGADEPLVFADQFAPIMKARAQRLMAVIDIAVPRDFDPRIGDLENVLLWNIDDLEQVRHRTLRSRERELDKALQLVDSETEDFLAVLAARESGTFISQLEEQYQKITEQELAWLLPQLNGISAEQQAKVRQFAHRLKNKFLHSPKSALRAEARQGTATGLLEALRKLFGLGE